MRTDVVLPFKKTFYCWFISHTTSPSINTESLLIDVYLIERNIHHVILIILIKIAYSSKCKSKFKWCFDIQLTIKYVNLLEWAMP